MEINRNIEKTIIQYAVGFAKRFNRKQKNAVIN